MPPNKEHEKENNVDASKVETVDVEEVSRTLYLSFAEDDNI